MSDLTPLRIYAQTTHYLVRRGDSVIQQVFGESVALALAAPYTLPVLQSLIDTSVGFAAHVADLTLEQTNGSASDLGWRSRNER